MLASLFTIAFAIIAILTIKWIKDDQERRLVSDSTCSHATSQIELPSAVLLHSPETSKFPHSLYWFLMLAAILRILVRLHRGANDFWTNGYTFFFSTAQGIAAGKGIASADGIPESIRVPVYSIVLAGLTHGHKFFLPIVIAEALFGTATAYCAALLCREMFSSVAVKRPAIVAVGITALYPYYIVHDTALQETSLFTLLTIMGVLLMMRTASSGDNRTGALAGLILGLDVLTRLAIVPVAVLAPFWLIWKKRTTPAIMCAIALALTTFPWIWRNYLLVGTPTLSTETGLQFWSGNNGYLFNHFPRESRDFSTEEALRELSVEDKQELQLISDDQVKTDSWFREKAYQYILTHPEQALIDAIRKNVAAFNVLPSPRHGSAANLVYMLSYGPVISLALWGIWQRRKRWRQDSLIILLFVTFVMISAMYWAHTSHRSYLDIYLIVFAAGTLTGSNATPNAAYRSLASCAENNGPS